MIKIKVKKLNALVNANMPVQKTIGSSGFDLVANIIHSFEIEPGGRIIIPTGIAIEIPVGFEGQVRSRSGLAANNGIVVLNSPGTIDSDYRGELKVILANHSFNGYLVKPGDRIAQLVIAPVCMVKLEESDELSDTDRGSGGFGHTGK